jgi:Ca2+-binding RTX toxin-like protein
MPSCLRNAASASLFGNEGNDTIEAGGAVAAAIVGGNDSADGSDSILGGTGGDRIFGNGGNDTIDGGGGVGANTLIGGNGSDSLTAFSAGSADLFFGNEGNDTVISGGGNSTLFGGLGNDLLAGSAGRDTIQGNEGNDTVFGDNGSTSIDTIARGSGNDVFVYASPSNDGNNASGGGPVEFVTDVDFSADKFQTMVNTVTFAANMGAGTGVDLASSANNAIAAALALSGSATAWVAAQFTFGGHTYLAIDQITRGSFLDSEDLLIDITGATGAIGTGNFV